MDYTSDTRILTVVFNNSKNCFVHLPTNWILHENQGPVILEIQNTTSQVKCYVTWAGRRCPQNEMSINGLFGHKLGLHAGNEVLVKVMSSMFTSACLRATVQPVSADDWELISLNANTIESDLIHQIRSVWTGMTFPIWVTDKICVFVSVGSVSPDGCPVLLQEQTEIIVSPPGENDVPHRISRNNSGKKTGESVPAKREVTRTSSVNTILNKFSTAFMNVLTPLSPPTQLQEQSPIWSGTPDRSELLKEDISVALQLRVLSLRSLLKDMLPDWLPPTTVFVNESSFGESGTELPNSFLCYASKILSPVEILAVDKDQEDKTKPVDYRTEKEVIRVILVRDGGSHPLPCKLRRLGPGSVAVPDLLRRQMGLEVTAKLWIQSIAHSEETTAQPAIVLHPLTRSLSQSEDKLTESFRNWLSSLRMPLATSGAGTLVHFPRDGGRDLVLKVELPVPEGKARETKAYWILKGTGNGVKIGQTMALHHTQWGAKLPCKLEVLDQKSQIAGPTLGDLGGVENVKESILEWIDWSLGLSPLSQELSVGPSAGVPCLLLWGPKGVGKSALCQAICQGLRPWKDQHIHTVIFPCRNLRGKRVESLHKLWQLELSECLHRQPSLLVLEDLDLIASAPSGPAAEAGLDALYFSRIAQTLISSLDVIEESRLAILVTSKSTRTLHPKLTASRGRHFFSKVVQLQPPDMHQRQEILKSLLVVKAHLSAESLSNVSLPLLATRTEGYVAQDLEMLVDRATHAAFLSEANTGLRYSSRVLSDESFEVALLDFKPSSLCGLALHSDPTKSWQDLGGLKSVKDALMQTLIWPLKYPKLFEQSPLRVQSGVLLYGAPGTGKTLLAGILAAESGLNFISIKGPELLSKYIGASEQAVRDLFQRAQSAKPCILFFDEFDAIVPRRGHDSTGVTDRVVNQFLTQMDGVEALSGVYVLAATSRPDLIDPALLRPGRIDKCLHCPLPQQFEREEILECLSRRLYLDHDVDLSALAEETDHFSGADLQALLYNAQLEALQDLPKHKATGIRSDSEVSQLSEEDVFYIPNLQEGPKDLSDDPDRVDIIQQMERVTENSFKSSKKPSTAVPSRHRRRSSMMPPCVSQHHMIKSLQQTKTSVLSRDITRLQTIYERFQRSPDADFPPLRQRATLA